MSLEFAKTIVALLEAYTVAGAAFAMLFLGHPIGRVDHRIDASPKTLRLLIFPGVMAFWPLFAWRWMSGTSELVERNPHRTKAGLR